MCVLGSEAEIIYKNQGDSKKTRILKVWADVLDGEGRAPGLWTRHLRGRQHPGGPRPGRDPVPSLLPLTDRYKDQAGFSGWEGGESVSPSAVSGMGAGKRV